jgi:hypothetical protein
MAEPTYAALIDAIIAVHGSGDKAFNRYWSDVYDGRAWRAFPEFWATLRNRGPNLPIQDVVALWTPEELRALYDRLLWGEPSSSN